MIATFSRYTEDNRYINRPSLIELNKADINLLDNTDILHPSLLVKVFKGYGTCNSVYITGLDRFYNVRKITLENGRLLRFDLDVDALYTYADSIKSIRCVIERSEETYNKYLIDNDLPTTVERNLSVLNVGTVGSATGSIVLNVVN